MSFTCGTCGLVIRSQGRLYQCIEAHFQHCRPQCLVCHRTVSRPHTWWEVDNLGAGSAVHKDCLDRNLRLPLDHPERCMYLQWV